MRGNFPITAILCVAFGGCSYNTRPPPPDYSKQALNVREALDTAFSGTDSITFRSWNGKWIGTDCDTDVELKADGTAVLTEYSVAIYKYHGTYSISDLTKVSLKLRDYTSPYLPTMYLITDDSALLLVPADNSNHAACWPLRQLPAKNEPDRDGQH